MSIAYFDCFSGAGGDMIVAALIDAGADPDALRAGLASLGVAGYDLGIDSVRKQGFAATRFTVSLTEQGHQPHRHLKHIVEILDSSSLPATVVDRARRIFTRLAEAEAAVHGSTIEQVHFHEVGAVDAIVDVVGAVLALDQLGIERIVCSPLPTGSGTVTCDHGVMPVPAPATAELLKGVPIAHCDEVGELLTPTAAAVLTTLASEFGPLPAMTIHRIGYGAGTRDGKQRPNVLRVLTGRATETFATDEITVLETNVDDTTPEILGHCMERLLVAGALDVYAVPIQMKKSRSGVLLCVLCEHAKAADLERMLFAETTTFGIRRHRAARAKLQRRHETVTTRFGEIRMKVGEGYGIETASPEFEDCRTAAGQHQVALRVVMAAAHSAWQQRRGG